MKPIFLVIAFFTISFSTVAQSDTKKRIVDSVCACLTAMPESEKKSKEQLEAAIGQCMMQKSMSDFMALAEERNIELTDMEGMKKIGMEIGMDLVKSDCKAMASLITKFAQEKGVSQEKSAPEVSPTVKGLVQTVTVSDFVYITVLSGAKSVKLVWSDYVENGNDFVNDFSKLKNKNITFSFNTKDVYSPKEKAYVTVNMIAGIKL